MKTVTPLVKPHRRELPLKVGTRGSPLARAQTATFLGLLEHFCPVLRGMEVFQEHIIVTTGDAVQDRALAEIGGKGLFAKEIHDSLAAGRIDFAVHSLKDLETTLPPGISLACTLKREDARDVLILLTGHVRLLWCFWRLPYRCAGRLGLIVGGAVKIRSNLSFSLLRGNIRARLGKSDRAGSMRRCWPMRLAAPGLAGTCDVVPGPRSDRAFGLPDCRLRFGPSFQYCS